MPRLGDTPSAARRRVPAVIESYLETRDTVLVGGLVPTKLKELCARFLAGEAVAPQDERERAALDWSYAIAWDSDRADAELWERLHQCFQEPELVELGYAVAFMLGQQHWARTLGLLPEIPHAQGARDEAAPALRAGDNKPDAAAPAPRAGGGELTPSES